MLKKKLAAGATIAVVCLAAFPLAAHSINDTDPPSINNVGWQPQHPNDSDTITVTARVTDDSGVAWVNLIYCYDGTCYPPVPMSGSSGTYSATIGPFEEGTLSFHIEAKDTVGNTGQTQEYSLFIDGTAPSVGLISPNGGEYLSGTVDIEWRVNDNGDNYPDIKVSYRNNGAWQTIDFIPDAHVDEVTWDTMAVADGGNYWAKITAVDDAGNTAEDVSNSNFTVDNTPPYTTVDLKGEKSGEWFVSNVTVTLDASDNTSGVSTVFYRIDNGTWNTYNTSFEIEENGEHTVSYYAADRAGNEEDEQSVTVNVRENYNPQKPTIEGPTSGKINTPYTYKITANDPEDDQVKYKINWGDGQSTETNFYPSSQTVSISHTWTEYIEGAIKVNAIDKFGAKSPTGTLHISMPKSKQNKNSNSFLNNIFNNQPLLNFFQSNQRKHNSFTQFFNNLFNLQKNSFFSNNLLSNVFQNINIPTTDQYNTETNQNQQNNTASEQQTEDSTLDLS